MKREALQAGSVVGAAGSALGSAAASICCIGPIGIAILGVQGAIFAAGLKPYRWYLLGASALFLALAFAIAYRPARHEGTTCPTGIGRWTKIVLWISGVAWAGAVVLQLVADRLWV